MKHAHFTYAGLIIVSIIARSAAGEADAPAYRIAAFSADVTPPIGHPLLAGATVTPDAKRIDDPLFALGFVLLGDDARRIECQGKRELHFQPRPLEWVVATAVTHWEVPAKSSWRTPPIIHCRLRSQDSAALATSVHLVCRPRAENAEVGDRGQVLRELPKRVADWMGQTPFSTGC